MARKTLHDEIQHDGGANAFVARQAENLRHWAAPKVESTRAWSEVAAAYGLIGGSAAAEEGRRKASEARYNGNGETKLQVTLNAKFDAAVNLEGDLSNTAGLIPNDSPNFTWDPNNPGTTTDIPGTRRFCAASSGSPHTHTREKPANMRRCLPWN